MTTTDEIARLREALRQIIELQDYYEGDNPARRFPIPLFICREYRNIARAALSTPSTTSGERSPTRAEDEALRTAHQSSTTLVEYLDTPPTIGTAEQAAQKCDALAATYPSGSEARSALHNAALMIRAIKDIPSAEGRQ